MCSFFDCLWLQGLYLVKNIFEIPSSVPDVPHHPPGKIQIECFLFGSLGKKHS